MRLSQALFALPLVAASPLMYRVGDARQISISNPLTSILNDLTGGAVSWRAPRPRAHALAPEGKTHTRAQTLTCLAGQLYLGCGSCDVGCRRHYFKGRGGDYFGCWYHNVRWIQCRSGPGLVVVGRCGRQQRLHFCGGCVERQAHHERCCRDQRSAHI